MPLAEGPSIDGGTLAVILAVLVLLFLAWLGAVFLGFRWAARAARGDRNAAGLWWVAMVVVVLPGLLGGPNPLLLAGLPLVIAQAIVYASLRRP